MCIMNRLTTPSLATALTSLCLLTAATPALADTPANDNRADAAQIKAGSTVSGTTVGASRESTDPASCPKDGGASVWYRYEAPHDGLVRLALKTSGKLDAEVAIYRVDNSTIEREGCASTRRGSLIMSDYLDEGEFLIRVSEKKGSKPGSFSLRFSGVLTEPKGPGRLLGRSGRASGSIDGFDHPFVKRSRKLKVGHDYRVRVSIAGGRCATTAYLRAPNGGRRWLGCRGYSVITPRPGQGGRWTVSLASSAINDERYDISITPVGNDDLAPGHFVAAFGRAKGSVSGRGPDAQDIYRFDVTKRAEVTLRLKSKGSMVLRLRNERGRPITSTSVDDDTGRIRTRLRPGRFYLVVDASDSAGGAYTLSRLTRVITSTTVRWSQPEHGPGGSSTLNVDVAGARRGRATVTLERFDPQFGWRYWTRKSLSLSGGHASVTVPTQAIGRYRAKAAYAGSRDASPSHSRKAAYLRIVAPLRD